MNHIAHDPSAATIALADRIALRLSDPAPTPPEHRWHAQSLANGATGIALLHIARAFTGFGRWDTAHSWLAEASRSDVLAAPDTGLYLGAPAVAFALHTASADGSDRYRRAIRALNPWVTSLTHHRIDQAYARIAGGQRPTLAEFDVISGLTGIGAHLLRHRPGDDALERILHYLVRLSEPLSTDGESLPAWWTEQDPHAGTSAEFPGGHANIGIAHGITGPLALLALAERQGIVVDGQRDAIERICFWLDGWRQDHARGSWWPQWITREDRRRRHVYQRGPLRPSWCYGTPGIARAQQLAAIATGDTSRQHMAENALAACLSDPGQLDRIEDSSLCHGWAGLYQTVWRAAADATTPLIAAHLSDLASSLFRHAGTDAGAGTGFLEGAAGLALALYTAAGISPTTSGWDACLLIA